MKNGNIYEEEIYKKLTHIASFHFELSKTWDSLPASWKD